MKNEKGKMKTDTRFGKYNAAVGGGEPRLLGGKSQIPIPNSQRPISNS